MHKLAVLFLSAFAFISTSSIAAGDAAKGEAKAATCIACHGVGGNSVVPTFPKLAGQGESYLLKQLVDFKSGARKDPMMFGIVAALNEDDMANLAAYYSKQTLSPGAASKTANLELGRKIYVGGKKATGVTACIACHGPTGTGIPSAGFPSLSSQHAMYISKQLKAFRQDSINTQTGDSKASRTNDGRGMMINFTKSLTNAEIEAVSQYIAGLH